MYGHGSYNEQPYTASPGPVGGTVNYVLTCAVGAYVYTGQAATLTVGHVLSLAAGSYAYTGQDAILTFVGTEVKKSTGFYGVSYRRKKRRDEDIREAVLSLYDGKGLPEVPEVSVVEDGEEEIVTLSGLSKRNMDAVIVAILASEL